MKFLDNIKGIYNKFLSWYRVVYSMYPFWSQFIPLALGFISLILIALINPGVAIALAATIILIFVYKATIGQ